MSGQRITNCVRTLRLFLQSLPTGVRFNIVSFGCQFTSLFSEPQLLTKTSLAVRPLTYVSSASASPLTPFNTV